MIRNPYWFKHCQLNDKQREELHVYLNRKEKEERQDFSYLNDLAISKEPFEDVIDVEPSIEEEYIFDADTFVF